MFKTNEYFEGKVASISHAGYEGNATVGVIAPGEYSFDTSTIEIMTVISGENEWNTYKKFESFRVEKNTTFNVKVKTDTPYLCVYL